MRTGSSLRLWRSILRLGPAARTTRQRVHPSPSRVFSLLAPRLCPSAVNDASFAQSPLATTTEFPTESIQINNESVQPGPDGYVTISFYRFVPLGDSERKILRDEMHAAFTNLSIVGRIYIAAEGVNGQISCPATHVPRLRAWCDASEEGPTALRAATLSGIRFNLATRHDRAFRQLDVRHRKQIVADGLDPTTYDINKAPTYLSPKQWHDELSSSSSSEPILIDMRNHYESELGYFQGAIRPNVDTFREEIGEMFAIADAHPGKPIYMYCTGGIRCSKAGAILRSRGHDDVRALDGGITAYGSYIAKEKGRVKSIFRGANFTFDKRRGEPIAAEDIVSSCHQCDAPCDTYTNCPNRRCNLLFLQCPACAARYAGTCGEVICMQVVAGEAALPPGPCVHSSVSRKRPRDIMRQWPVVLKDIRDKVRPRTVLARMRARRDAEKISLDSKEIIQ